MTSPAIKLFLDGAEIQQIRQAVQENPMVKGFTTNPTLMRKAGITDYAAFAKEALETVNGLPISFEVFSDDFESMEREARIIAGWGGGANVKIPITNTKGESSAPLIARLSRDGIMINATAIMTLDQVRLVAEALSPETPAIVSVFAGRVADTGRDPIPHMQECLEILKSRPKAELLWASPREALNIYQAAAIGCHIITATADQIAKLKLRDKDLDEYSLETVKMFYKDATAAGYRL
ncbi:transaldolase [Deltaproteobacteria bacterium OttesenSCG-928-K17]|nr:transaldolase [Deltaproteobacteria bacterium OttesenSCG-928-K17]